MPPRRSDDDRRLPENRAVDVHFAAGRPAGILSPATNTLEQGRNVNFQKYFFFCIENECGGQGY